MFPNNTPYTDLHEINLNKFLKAIKNLLGGHGGEYLKKKSNIPFDYEWTNIEVTSGVQSVNGQTGAVVLDADDVGALPDTYTAPVQSVNGQTGAVVLDADDVGALPDSYTPPTAIAFNLTAGESGITTFARGIYDPVSRTVRIYLSARSTSNITTAMALATIPEAYRPAETKTLLGCMVNNANLNAVYYGYANTDGTITQRLGNTIREVFLCGEYTI